MTPEETEFARLLDKYETALANHSRLNEPPSNPPQYETGRGHITPAFVAAYKTALADFEKQKEAFEASKLEVKAAVKELDEYFPASVRTKINEGAATITHVQGGMAALIKKAGTYEIVRGRDLADVQSRLSNRLSSPR